MSGGAGHVKAIRKHQRILQTGSHYRSSPANRFACELVRNGRIGEVKKVIGVAPQNAVDPGPGWKPMPVPEGFDYEMWFGPAPKVPYHKDRCLYRFRFNLEYSGGQTPTSVAVRTTSLNGDWGWTKRVPSNSRTQVPGALPGRPVQHGNQVGFRARYANGVELLCGTTKTGFGTRFEGTEGWVEFGYKGVITSPNP